MLLFRREMGDNEVGGTGGGQSTLVFSGHDQELDPLAVAEAEELVKSSGLLQVRVWVVLWLYEWRQYLISRSGSLLEVVDRT